MRSQMTWKGFARSPFMPFVKPPKGTFDPPDWGFLHEMAVAGMLALLTQRLANASVKLGFYPT
jgi:hypothetical protein